MGGGGISAEMAGGNPPRPGVAEDSVPKLDSEELSRSFRPLVFSMLLRGSLLRACGDAKSPMKPMKYLDPPTRPWEWS